jgi:CheY-like chemotaxis protein
MKRHLMRFSAHDAGLPGLRVLVADDHRDAADSLATLLRFWGHEAVVAYDGHSALREAANTSPQVVLLDLEMPGLSGYEVAPRIRQLHGPSVRIAAVTGFGDPAHREPAMGVFDAYLLKPVDLGALRDLLLEWAVSASDSRDAPVVQGTQPTARGTA